MKNTGNSFIFTCCTSTDDVVNNSNNYLHLNLDILPLVNKIVYIIIKNHIENILVTIFRKTKLLQSRG
jgi:hypothetical protein